MSCMNCKCEKCISERKQEENKTEKIYKIIFECLQISMNEVDFDWDNAKIFGTDDYFKAAAAIAEPFQHKDGLSNLLIHKDYVEVENEYSNLIENKIDNWINYIGHNFGNDWKAIALLIKENGY